MASDDEERVECLIVDSAAFLKNVPVENMGRNVFTVREVISEIRSASIRERLAVLPYEINFRVPSTESMHVVSEFAKRTGDFQSLSVVDLKVLALTFQLHKEKCGTEDLRLQPTKQVEVIDKQPQGQIPGFFVRTKNNHENNEEKEETWNSHENIEEQLQQIDDEKKLLKQITDCSLNENEYNNEETVEKTQQLNKPLEKTHAVNDTLDENKIFEVGDDKEENEVKSVQENGKYLEDYTNMCKVDYQDNFIGNDNGNSADDDDGDNKDEGGGDDDDDDDDDNGGDWITPENISQIKSDLGMLENKTRPTNVIVGCLTTDFAIQNVLIQMGLHVISVDGMLIREARSYVLKCYSCFKVTSQMQRLFCPKCGNHTMVKISVSIGEDGVTHYHMPKRKKPFNIRGKKHPLPLPKGGRHSNNPLLFEDQLISQRCLPKVKENVNVLDQDYIARSSPFARNDTTSRAFNLGFHVHGRIQRNPNEGWKKTRRKKK